MNENKITVMIILILLSTGLSFNFLQSSTATLTKVWSYEYTPKEYNWSYKFIDQWGGVNSQCIIPDGNQCGKWDWSAVYVIDKPNNIEPDDPCPGINYPEYGHNFVVASAGPEAPTYLPTFTFNWE